MKAVMPQTPVATIGGEGISLEQMQALYPESFRNPPGASTSVMNPVVSPFPKAERGMAMGSAALEALSQLQGGGNIFKAAQAGRERYRGELSRTAYERFLDTEIATERSRPGGASPRRLEVLMAARHGGRFMPDTSGPNWIQQLGAREALYQRHRAERAEDVARIRHEKALEKAQTPKGEFDRRMYQYLLDLFKKDPKAALELYGKTMRSPGARLQDTFDMDILNMIRPDEEDPLATGGAPLY